MLKHVLAILVLTLLLVGCGAINRTPTQTIEITQPIIRTATPSIEPTVQSTQAATATATSTPTITPLPTETPTPAPYGPSDFPENVNPLTGQIVGDPGILDRRPLAVKVNVVPRSSNRPPWGLSFADIVYDYYHNDGYSRFHAIFYGTDAELVGPIRSGRLLDYELVHMYQSIFTYGSADAKINERLNNSDFANRLILEHQTAGCPPSKNTPLCRYDPAGYDFLLGDTAAMSDYISERGVSNGRQNLDGMSFDPEVQPGGIPGNQVYVRYSGDNYVRWDYDSDTGLYLRFQDNVFDTGQGEDYAPLTDRLTDEQISASNVVVVIARHEYAQQPPAEIIEILLSGSGKAYAFRDGQMYELLWSRPTTTSVLSLMLEDGTPFPYKPGKTWFQVVGAFTQVSQPTEDSWRFNFHLP